MKLIGVILTLLMSFSCKERGRGHGVPQAEHALMEASIVFSTISIDNFEIGKKLCQENENLSLVDFIRAVHPEISKYEERRFDLDYWGSPYWVFYENNSIIMGSSGPNGIREKGEDDVLLEITKEKFFDDWGR